MLFLIYIEIQYMSGLSIAKAVWANGSWIC